MTGREGCPGGVIDCDYSETHELALVGRIMKAVEQYNQDVQADPCPVCLRDAMLSVAALLHLRAAQGEDATDTEAEFSEAALEKLRAVADVVAGRLQGFKQ